jgi:TonB family protein
MIGITAYLMMTAAAVSGCNCRSGGWDKVVENTEELVVYKQPFKVPRHPVGSKYPDACVRIGFQIDGSGRPIDVRIDRSSESRAMDVAARETLKKYRFEVPSNEAATEFALVFVYPSSESP